MRHLISQFSFLDLKVRTITVSYELRFSGFLKSYINILKLMVGSMNKAYLLRFSQIFIKKIQNSAEIEPYIHLSFGILSSELGGAIHVSAILQPVRRLRVKRR